MAFNYLLDPCIQHQNRAGVNNVHGFFKVFLLETDDIAETYSDFSGTLNPERIEIDNNGRCVIIADDSRPYRVEMYLPNGDLVYTQKPIWTIASGGGGASLTDIESSDGSISVDKTTVGGKTTFDIGVNHEDDPAFLDWIKCSGSSASSGNLVPNKADGTMSVGSLGVELSADMLYHVTGIVRGTKDGVGPDYDSIEVHLSLNDGETSTEVQTFTFIVDRSLGLPQDFNFDADIKAGSVESELVVSVTGAEAGMSFSLPLLDIHRVYSGIPKLPGGIATQEWVDDHYQEKLTAGTGISIDPDTNVISADAAQQVQSDWNEADTSSPAYIKNKPDMDSYATDQELTAGLATKQDVIQDIADIRAGAAAGATAVQPADLASALDPYATKQEVTTGLAGKQDTISDLATIRSGAAAGATAVQPGDLAAVATSGSYNDLSDKPSIPPAQVQSDWNEADSAAVDYIKNKPDLSGFATKTEVTQGLAGKQDTISDLATIRAGAAEGATAVQPGDLATVATSGSYNDLSDKPSIPAAQVNADWNASSGVAEILNKPTLATVATTGDYDDLSNKPTINNVPPVGSADAGKVLTASYSGGVGSYSWTTPSGGGEVFIATYGTTPFADILAAINADKVVFATNEDGEIYSLASYSNSEIVFSQAWCSYSKLGVTKLLVNNQSVWSAPGLETVPVPDTNWAAGEVLTDNGDGTVSWQALPAQVQSDWNEADSSAADYIKNKPNLASVATSGSYSDLSGTPTVDQVYDSSSTDAQSGTAVAGAISSAVSGINQVPASTAADSSKVLTVNSSGTPVWDNAPTEIFYVTYGTTTFQEIRAAKAANKVPVLKYGDVLIPLDKCVSQSSGTSFAEFKRLAPNDINTANATVEITRYVVLSTDGGASTWDTQHWYIAPADWDATVGATRIINKPTIPGPMAVLSYGTSTWADFAAVYPTNRVVYCRASSNSNPGTGTQSRFAFMAYVNNPDIASATSVEFQYYRSVTSHSDATQGDEVFVYTLNKTTGWSVTKRNAYTKIAAGTNMTSSYSSGTLTLSADVPAMKSLVAGSNISITEDANGVTIAASVPVIGTVDL